MKLLVAQSNYLLKSVVMMSATTPSSLPTTTDSFMFIIGELGTPKMETKIDSNANPSEALRQYNNTNRAARAAIMCVVIFVPAWRQLAVRELVRLWLRSRKLYCRMRFGIALAYDLQLPCYVAPQALRTPEAQKTMPHIVARCSNDTHAQTDGELTTIVTTNAVVAAGDDTSRKRKRARRPSPYDSAVAEHVVFGDLSPDKITTTLEPCFRHLVSGALPPAALTSDKLDLLNTITYRHVKYCFTLGKQSNMSKRSSTNSKGRSGHRRRHHRRELDDDNNNDSDNEDDSANDEDEEEDEDDETKPKRRKKSRKPIGDRLILSNELAPAREKGLRETAMYSTSSSTIAPVDSSATAISAGSVVRRDCLSPSGTIDNRLLVARAEDCFSDTLDYLERPVTRVRLDKTQHCVCGARQSFVGGQCRECQRTVLSSHVFRTDVAWLKEQATSERCPPAERRALRRLMIASETETPIDIYSQTTCEQLRGALAAQQPSSSSATASTAQTNGRATRPPKETNLIRAALQRAVHGSAVSGL
jgi:hypothetical protein